MINERKKGISLIVLIVVITVILILAAVLVMLFMGGKIGIEDESHLGVKDITEVYSTNNLDIEEKRVTYGKTEGGNDDDYKVVISYPEISGLKDKTVQNKINAEIKDMAFKYYDESEEKDKSIQYVEIIMSVKANYADTLSISLGKNVSYVDENKEFDYYSDALNYRLDTGDHINFTDLFTNTTDIDNIIQEGLRTTLLTETMYGYSDGEGRKDEPSAAEIAEVDNKVKEYMKLYKEKGISEFCFDANDVYVTIADQNVRIKLEENKESVAIYKRFLSKVNIYDGTNKNENRLYVFMEPMSNYYKEGQYLDNLYINVYTSISTKESDKYSEKEYNKKCNEFADSVLDKYIYEAKNNPENIYILEGNLFLENGGYDGVSAISEEYYYTTISKEHYKNVGEVIAEKRMQGYNIEFSEWFFSEEDSNEKVKTVSIENITVVDENLNEMSFLEVQKKDPERFKKATKKIDDTFYIVTEENNRYKFILDGEIKCNVADLNEDTRNKARFEATGEVNDEVKEDFKEIKATVNDFLKETLDVDFSKQLSKLEIKHDKELSDDSAWYTGGHYILVASEYGVSDSKIASQVLEYLMVQSNATSDSLFRDSKNRTNNQLICSMLADRIASYIYNDYGNYIAYDAKVLNLLLDIYGKDLLKDAFLGRASVVEKDLKNIAGELAYEAYSYEFGTIYHVAFLNKFQATKGLSYDILDGLE